MARSRQPKLKAAENKKWEDLLAFHLQTNHLYPTHFKREILFIPGRRFRLDFGDEQHKVGIEVQGGVWTRGKSAHSHGTGLERDFEKLNLAILNGWTIFHFGSTMIRNLSAIDTVRRYYTHNLGIDLDSLQKPN